MAVYTQAGSTSSNTPVNQYSTTLTTTAYFTQANANFLLRTSCSIGQFGYTAEEISTHSLRAGAAMALYKANCSIPQIMQLGRWKSAAFLDYIRPAVFEWSAGLSRHMSSADHYTTRLRFPDTDILTEKDPFNGSNPTINLMPIFAL